MFFLLGFLSVLFPDCLGKPVEDAARSNNHAKGSGGGGGTSGVHWTAYGRPRGRPQPISGTPPLDSQQQHQQPPPSNKTAEPQPPAANQNNNIFGVDLESPPPVPPSRSYTVTGNSKLGFPQIRIMKIDFPSSSDFDIRSSVQSGGGGGNAKHVKLSKGEPVTVVGASTRRGHLLVEHLDQQFHVPYQFMEMPVTTLTAASIHDIRGCSSRRARSAVSSLSTGSHKRNKAASLVGNSVVSR